MKLEKQSKTKKNLILIYISQECTLRLKKHKQKSIENDKVEMNNKNEIRQRK